MKMRGLSFFMAVIIMLCSLPVFAQAEESFQLEAPTIEITTDKKSYGIYDTSVVTVKVYPSDGNPIENVNIEASLDKQLCSFKDNQFSAETKVLQSEGIEYSFKAVVSKKASGLNFFQKLVLFFKRLFTKTVTVTGKTFNDGRDLTTAKQEIKFGSAKGLITINVWYDGTVENVDADNDGLIDYIERVNGTNPNLADTDSDGLSDYDEFVTVGTDPTLADSNGNGINDYNDDNDGDGLSNGYELTLGTSANSDDTDCDELKDDEEVNNYKTSPVKEDTDGDGATDGWEVKNGFNPLKYDSSFEIEVECENNGLVAGVKMTSTGSTAESITISPLKNNYLINSSIPGYIGSAFEFNADGDIGTTKLTFAFDKSLQSNNSIKPTIYWFDENNQTLVECDTTINDNIASTTVNHFSKYILLDSAEYNDYLNQSIDIDFSNDDGTDSNNDGISDFITKLLCDGIIRTGTGAKAFGDVSFEDIQENDDYDSDGLKNGEEVNIENIYEGNHIIDTDIGIREFNGHNYCVLYLSDILGWHEAESYCELRGGHLATITSSSEQSFIQSLIPSNQNYWIGGTDEGHEGKWTWVTGEDWQYTNWCSNQPDNYSGDFHVREDFLIIWANEGYRWDDNCDIEMKTVRCNFICEWDNCSTGAYNYVIYNSSPILKDTDSDGFADNVDPTPLKADAFYSIEDYIKNKFKNEYTLTLLIKQPVFGSNAAINDSNDVGHSFVLLSDGKDSFSYRGFYPNSWVYSKYSDYIDYTVHNIYTRGAANTPGIVADDSTHEWDVAYTEKITWSQYQSAVSYINTHGNDEYNLQSFNCTTFAVEVLKAASTKISNYTNPGLWAIPPFYGALTFTIFYPYGYCPGKTGYDIMENASEYTAFERVSLKDGVLYNAVVERFNMDFGGGGSW